MRFPHLAARIFNAPLAIHRAKAETIMQAVILPKLRGEVFDPVDDLMQPASSRQGSIAVLPVHGTLVHRATGVDALSGLQSYDQIRGMLRSALGDSRVGAILLDVDSPGGEVAGMHDLADEIMQARKAKPIYAIGNDHAYSAAYLLYSSAERLFLTQTGGVGSIGIIAMHVDQSGLDEKMGLAYTPIFAGARKADLSPHAPLSDEARARIQADVDQSYDQFVEAVAKRRSGLSAKAVRATEALTYRRDEAVAAGLADEIGTLDDAVAALSRRITDTRPAGAVRGRSAQAPGARTMADAQTGVPESGTTSTTTPPVAGNVVDFEQARASGRSEGEAAAMAALQARSEEINDLCALAGLPYLGGELIAAKAADGKSPKPMAEIRKDLQRHKAEADERLQINSRHGPAAGAPDKPDHGWGDAFDKVARQYPTTQRRA